MTWHSPDILLGCSILLQTPECSEYHPFTKSQMVSALSLIKLQQHGTNFPLLCVMHPQFLQIFLENLPLFKNFFLQSPCPEVLVCVAVCVCVCVCLCVHVSVHACFCCMCIWIFDVQLYVCVRFVSTLGYVFQVRRAKCPLLLLLLYSDRIGYSTESDKKTRRLFNRIKTWRHIKILPLDNELTCMYTVWFVRAKW